MIGNINPNITRLTKNGQNNTTIINIMINSKIWKNFTLFIFIFEYNYIKHQRKLN